MTPDLRDRVVRLLEAIEWSIIDTLDRPIFCPVCMRKRGKHSHEERCELAAVLRELRADVLLVQAPFIPGEGAISLVRTCCAFHAAKDAGQLRPGKFYRCCDPSEALQEPLPHGRP